MLVSTGTHIMLSFPAEIYIFKRQRYFYNELLTGRVWCSRVRKVTGYSLNNDENSNQTLNHRDFFDTTTILNEISELRFSS